MRRFRTTPHSTDPAVPRSLTTVLTTRLSRRLFVTFNLSPLLLCFIVQQYLKLHVKWWSIELNQNVWCIWTFNFNSLHFLTTLFSAFCMIRSLSFKNSPAGWQFSWNINKRILRFRFGTFRVKHIQEFNHIVCKESVQAVLKKQTANRICAKFFVFAIIKEPPPR